jgi:acetyl/propionyl-CoA carboxylase alpha subunit
VVIKDPLSGGGKAMRIAYSPKEFEAALSTVLSESKRLTGAKNILIEKYIKLGRHIEIQIAGDGENYIHLFERECSIQRRNQKVIEESPCCFISQKTKETLYRAALLAAKSVNYKNIGTVEFIVTPEEKFYFLEVNTRLQVEHSVTEMTTGIDLVALQFQIAQDKKLLYTQEDIKHNGHAIECRIYSEDPERNFLPTTGAITNIALPTGPFTRTDCAVYNGYTVTPHFDPMLAKVTVYGYTRDHAIKYLKGLLERSSISGVITNINLLCQLLETTEFTLGKIHTKLLSDQNFIKKILSKPSQETSQEILPDLSFAQEIKEEILAGCALILLEELTQEKIIKRQESSWRTSHLDNFYKNY